MTPIQQVLYTTSATAHGAREGRVKTDDGNLDLNLSMPKALGGGGGEGTNPEQLFACGYAACFESALRFVARTQKIAFKDVQMKAKVSIGKIETGGFGLAVELHGVFSGIGQEGAVGLMELAHKVCPYSNATRGNIDVKLSAEVSEPAA